MLFGPQVAFGKLRRIYLIGFIGKVRAASEEKAARETMNELMRAGYNGNRGGATLAASLPRRGGTTP
jgi:hypothetical protein